MLHSVKVLRGSSISAADERFGFVVDLYFDDRTWVVRYLVLDTGRPMPQRSVLLQPGGAASLDATGTLRVSLPRKRIEKLPDWLSVRPVYLQHDMSPAGHLGDEHLRSMEFVLGCAVQARNGGLGHVADLLLDADRWEVPYIVVESGHFLAGRRAKVSTQAVERIDWPAHSLRLSLPREAATAPS